jgi:hypothetical protein
MFFTRSISDDKLVNSNKYSQYLRSIVYFPLQFKPMDHHFALPISYKGVDQDLDARMQSWAYGYRFFVLIDGVEWVFERDDAGEYRALMSPEPTQAGAHQAETHQAETHQAETHQAGNPGRTPGRMPEKGLLEAIVQALEALQHP